MIHEICYDPKHLVISRHYDECKQMRLNKKKLSKQQIREVLVEKATAYGAVANGNAVNDDGEMFLEFLFDQNTSACFHGWRFPAKSAMLFKIDVYNELWVMPVVYYDNDFEYLWYCKGELARDMNIDLCESLFMPKKVSKHMNNFLDTLFV